MDWKFLLSSEVQEFIKAHEGDDFKALALKKAPDLNCPYPLILDQIKVRQKAKIKSSDLYETNGFIFPKNDLYEQASSQPCAVYKASLLSGGSFVDLTSGCGADSFQISKHFVSSVLVERDEYSASLLEHNASALLDSGYIKSKVNIRNVDAVNYIDNIEDVDSIFIDPQRRESGRKALYDFSACSPDITKLLPILKNKAKKILIKASPFLDIEKAIRQLGMVVQVHVVQWRGECKEVLYLLDCDDGNNCDDPEIIAVNIDDTGNVKNRFSYFMSKEKTLNIEFSKPLKYILEPSAAMQKAGGFKSIATHYGIKKIHPNSHIYTADFVPDNFVGKGYEVVGIYPARAKSLPVKKSDLVVRNFPMAVKDLRKKLKLSDGGEHRIFATTLYNGNKSLILCTKP